MVHLKTISCWLIFLCLHSVLFSQEKIKGSLFNQEKEPIPYVNIWVPNTGKGTITNLEGEFELAIPQKSERLQIQLSCIGYKSVTYRLDSLLKIQQHGDSIKLHLNHASYQLQEVTIGKQEILKDPQQIFTRAIHQIPNLLADKAFIGKYYFRQTHKDDSSMNRLIEAAISIYDPGVKHDISECKFNVNHLRSSMDNRVLPHELNLYLYRFLAEKRKSKHHPLETDLRIPEAPGRHKPDTIWKDRKIQTYLTKVFDDHYASLSGFFNKTNMIRNVKMERRKKSDPINPKFENGGPLITTSFVKEHELKLDTILLYNDNAVYKIKILPNKKYPGIDYQRNRYVPVGWAYIRVKDFAFLGLDYAYITNPNNKGFKYKGKYHSGFNGKFQYYFKFIIRYKEYNKKLYPNYLYYQREDYNNIPFANLFANQYSEYLKIPTMNGRQLCIQEIINTEVVTDSTQIKSDLEQLNWKGDQFEKCPYNKEFWDNYSTLLPTEKEQNMKNQLELELLNKATK
ncbi:carboxypeptidase-like regulatory domain-containing protein [Labilibaculum euxinus]